MTSPTNSSSGETGESAPTQASQSKLVGYGKKSKLYWVVVYLVVALVVYGLIVAVVKTRSNNTTRSDQNSALDSLYGDQ